MRILALGQPLPDASIDNYNWASALSFFDYDAIIIDPKVAVSDFIEGVTRDGLSFTSYDEEPVENGPTTANSIGLADLLRRRRDEVEAFLGRGGLIVCFAYPDVAHPHVSGFTGAHRYYWLPAPEGVGFSDFIRMARGTQVVTADFEHPFAEFLERHRTRVNYRATFVESVAGKAGKIIARSSGGVAIGAEFQVGGGRLIFLPAIGDRLGGNERTVAAQSLVSGVRNALLLNAEGPAPWWISNYALPGIEEAQARVSRDEEALSQAETELDDARDEFRSLDRFRRVLWQEGKFGLDLPVRDILDRIGFTVYSKPDEPGELLDGTTHIYVECEGGTGPIGMAAHYRLRDRIEQRIVAGYERPLGLIVANGYRDQPPDSRGRQYEDSLRVAAESMRYCVVEASRLFTAVRDAIEGRDNDVKTFRERLLATEGVYEDAAEPVPEAETT